MHTEWQQGLTCAPEIIAALSQFIKQLNRALAEELLSLVLYGELTRGETMTPRSSINVMIVLREVSTDLLDRAQEAVVLARREFRLSVMVLSERDLARSTDVFPIKFLDMQQHHRLLAGKDLLKDLKISQSHLRLRCEQEIKNLLLRLRQFYLQRVQFPEQIESTITDALPAFISDLGVLIKLKTGSSHTGQLNIVRAAVKDLCLNEDIMNQLIKLKTATLKPDQTELKQLYNNFMQLVQQAAEIADQLEE